MIAANEPLTHWLEHITYQMTKMSYKEAAMKLAGPISLLKYQATRTSLMISDNAVQIFGGRGITRTGMGSKVQCNKNCVLGALIQNRWIRCL